MIITLTPNPAVDITYAVELLVRGASHRPSAVHERAGGKGLNTAGVLTAMGLDAVAVAPVGPEELAWFGADLTGRGVRHRLVPAPRQTRRSITIAEATGTATVLGESGLAQPDAVWAGVAATVDELAATASVLTISGSLPPDSDPDLVRELTRRARSAGLLVILDVHGPSLRRALTAGATIVKPNVAEAAATIRAPSATSADGLAARLVAGGADVAIVSDGSRGLSFATRALGESGAGLRAWLRNPLSGNPTGAGDALTAALAADLDGCGVPSDLEGWSAVVRRAVAWSAAAVLQPIAGVIDPDDVARLHSAVEIEEIRP